MPRNPFTPTFGASPPTLIGRREVVDRLKDALAAGPGSPGYATIYTGGRGVGKTAMLNAAEDTARAAGFAVISETASPGLLDRLVHAHLPPLLPPNLPIAEMSSRVEAGAVAYPTETARALQVMIDVVTADQPVLITLDEIQAAPLDEIRGLAIVLQRAAHDGRRIAFCGAGLQDSLDELLGNEGVGFLRHAERRRLGAVALPDVVDAYVDVATNGRRMSVESARTAAQATDGYPFLIQLVGYHSWRQHRDHDEVTLDDVRAGIEAAKRRMDRLVIEPAFNDRAAEERMFLLQMTVDDGPSRMTDIAVRMEAHTNDVNRHRSRLIAAGLVESSGHGLVDFALPQLRGWLRERGISDALT